MTLWHILRAPTCRKLHMKSSQFVPLCCEDLLPRSKYHIYLSHTHRELFELLLFQFVRVYQLLCLVSFFFSSWNRSVVESCSSYEKVSFSDWGPARPPPGRLAARHSSGHPAVPYIPDSNKQNSVLMYYAAGILASSETAGGRPGRAWSAPSSSCLGPCSRSHSRANTPSPTFRLR